MADDKSMPAAVTWRLAVTVYGSIIWIVAVIVYIFFMQTGFTIWQNLAIVIISMLILGGVIAGLWIPWNPKMMKEMEKWDTTHKSSKK